MKKERKVILLLNLESHNKIKRRINDTLDWKETSDTKLREFQIKLLNRYLCGKENESFEHILISCNYTREFRAKVIKWVCNLKVNNTVLKTENFVWNDKL